LRRWWKRANWVCLKRARTAQDLMVDYKSPFIIVILTHVILAMLSFLARILRRMLYHSRILRDAGRLWFCSALVEFWKRFHDEPSELQFTRNVEQPDNHTVATICDPKLLFLWICFPRHRQEMPRVSPHPHHRHHRHQHQHHNHQL